MHRFPQIVFITFLILLTPFAQRAQAQYRFDSWTTDNGLPQGSVNSILQTRDGYIWLATFGGLVRFDGLRFQVFNTGNTKGLRSGRFIQLFEDRAGNLWMNTEGQGVTRYKDDVFTSFTTENGLPRNAGRLYEDADGNLRVLTDGGVVQWVDGTFKSVTSALGETSRSERTSSGAIWYLEGGILHKVEHGRITLDLNTGYNVNRFYPDR